MTSSEKKKSFAWKPGDRLDPDQYDALGKVREVGFTKLADGVYADPELRKKERKRRLTASKGKDTVIEGSVSGLAKKDKDTLIEESVSGLSHDFDQNRASHVMGRQGGQFKGVFGNQDPKNSPKTPKK